VLEESGLRAREVALVCLGSLGGWAANVPLAILGDTTLAVNVGGAIVAVVLVATWIRHDKLSLLPAMLGVALVALVAWRIVVFSPEEGVFASYPDFFLPIAASLAFALVASFRRLPRSAPLAYAAGTLGTLIGADLTHVSDMRARATGGVGAIISIGGALDLAVVVVVSWRKPALVHTTEIYPSRPVSFEDAARVLREYPRLERPHALDRAIAGLAMSDQAIRDRDYARSVRLSWLAVDSILKLEEVAARAGSEAHPDLRRDVDTLRAQDAAARATTGATLRQAGEANVAAKTIVGALARRTALRPTLEGVSV